MGPKRRAPAELPPEGGESELLARLRRGEVTLDAYLTFLAEEGAGDFAGLMTPERQSMIKELLLEQLATDPLLAAMIRRITGGDSRK